MQKAWIGKHKIQGYGAKCITPACSAGCPLQDLLSPLAAPRVLQHLNPALCHLPGLSWHIWNWNSFPPSSSHPSHTALFIQPESSWSPPAPHPTFPNYRNLPPDSSPTSFCSVQGRNSRLLPASPKCCHFPSCSENAPKEWHQEFCVQRSSRMTESAASSLTSPSSLELS